MSVEMEYARVSRREAHQWAEEARPFLFLSLWGARYLDPDSFLRLAFPWTLTGYGEGEYQDLVERAGRTLDQAERVALYARADRLLIEDAVVAPFEYGGHWWLVKPWVTRFPCATALRWMFWKEIVIEPH